MELQVASVELLKLTGDERAFHAIRLLEGLVAALMYVEPPFKPGGRPSKSTAVEALKSAATKLLFAVKAKSETESPLVLANRFYRVVRLMEKHLEKSSDPKVLAAALDIACTAEGAAEIFPNTLTTEDRVKVWLGAIKWLFSDGTPAKASDVVLACARASGFKRPSRLKDARRHKLARARKKRSRK
ncbi:MAG TPA: hypothetical protein VGI10_22660 [Polyangiaceae bacterium]